MEVEIYRVTLTIEKRKVRLTKAIAKQFPILDGGKRWRAAERGEEQPTPSCKVRAKVLNKDSYRNWLYLVKDNEAGLGWVAPCVPMDSFALSIVKSGGWVDTPAEVPTVIL